KLFVQQYSSTSSTKQNNTSVETVAPSITAPSFLSISHLQQTIADEIIKKPTYFCGSKDDIHDWLDKLEQPSISIKTWSSFTEAVIKVFGSTKVQELAFEQLKWYKQTVNQPVTQYYDKIIELCKKVDAAISDSLKLKYLMAGIRESLKLHVALQHPKTTDAFLSLATKIDDTLLFTTTDNEININTITTQKSLEQTTISQKS
ncbi:unnamed protein product, partial [Rotaria sordida]